MSVGLSKAKLSQAMLEILLQLPVGTTHLKETVVYNVGFLGQMSTTRDINEAWNQTKKRAIANFKKLNELADIENCSADKLISKLIKYYSHVQKEKDSR